MVSNFRWALPLLLTLILGSLSACTSQGQSDPAAQGQTGQQAQSEQAQGGQGQQNQGGQSQGTQMRTVAAQGTQRSQSQGAQAQGEQSQGQQAQGQQSQGAQAQEGAQAATRRVRVVQAEPGELTSQRSTSVTIEPGQESQIAAGTSGTVASIVAQEGSRVQEGDTVVRLDTEDLQLQVDNARTALQSARINLQSAQNSNQEGTQQAQDALQAAQTNLNLAQQQYQEGQQLFDAGGISQTQLTQFKAQLEQAQASFQQAQTNVSQLQRAPSESLELQRLQVQQAQNQLTQAQRALNDADVTAPYTGEVADVLVSAGEFVGAGSPAFRLVSTEEQLAEFSVPPRDASALVEEGLVYINYNGLDYAAQVIRSEPVPGDSRLINISAQIYPSETRIPTGTVTQLNYTTTLAQGIKLPSGAVSIQGGQSFVLAVQDGVARQQNVNVINESGGNVIVNGIDAGTQVVFPLPADLQGGTPVEIIQGNG